jgi:hypothetical protein
MSVQRFMVFLPIYVMPEVSRHRMSGPVLIGLTSSIIGALRLPPDNNGDNDHSTGLGMEIAISPSDLPLLSMLSLLPGSEEHGR